VSRVALVSGANRGIGAEIARQLAADHGFLVLAGARNPSEVEAAGNVTPVQLDVTDQASVDAALERIGSDPGKLDVLVNNAGIFGPVEGVAEIDLNEVGRVFEVNTIGAIRLSQAFIPLLRDSDHPRIVNVSSGAGQLSDMDGGRAAYRVSKAGLNAVTRIIAADEGGSGLLVNSLCPGWVRTDMGGPNARRSVEEGAETAVWLATLPDGGPTAGFFRDREPIPW
jgi:NAD(P)-dependent dehydrogenase (short-subunit alcohol dehydrogenase family)